MCLAFKRLTLLVSHLHTVPGSTTPVQNALRQCSGQLEDYRDLQGIEDIRNAFHRDKAVAAAPPVDQSLRSEETPAVGEKDSGKVREKEKRKKERSSPSPCSARTTPAKTKTAASSSRKSSHKGKKSRSGHRGRSSGGREKRRKEKRAKESSPSYSRKVSPKKVKEEPSPSPRSASEGDRVSPALTLPRIRSPSQPPPSRGAKPSRARSPSPNKPPGDFVLRPREPSQPPPWVKEGKEKPPEPRRPPPQRSRRERGISTRSKGVQRDQRNTDIYNYGFSDHRKRKREEEWK